MDKIKKLVDGLTPEHHRLLEIKNKIVGLEKESTNSPSKDLQDKIDELKKERDFLKNGGELVNYGKGATIMVEDEQKENKEEDENIAEEIKKTQEALDQQKVIQITMLKSLVSLGLTPEDQILEMCNAAGIKREDLDIKEGKLDKEPEIIPEAKEKEIDKSNWASAPFQKFEDDDIGKEEPENESEATEKNTEYEIKKAEIEKKRQDELNKEEDRHNNSITVNGREIDDYFIDEANGREYTMVTHRVSETSSSSHGTSLELNIPDFIKKVRETENTKGKQAALNYIKDSLFEFEKRVHLSLKNQINTKYDSELTELEKEVRGDEGEKEKPKKTSEEESSDEDHKENTEKSLWSEEMERELQAIKDEEREADIKLAQLLEIINQLPDDEEEETKNPETKIEEIENGQTYKKITKEDFRWSFQENYIDRVGKFELGDKLLITIEEFTQEQVKRDPLGRIFHSSPNKTIKLKKPFCELTVTQEGGDPKIYKLDNMDQAVNNADLILNDYTRKTAEHLGEVSYIPYEYDKGLEKIENNIKYFIKENLLSAIKKDKEEKPFLYFALEKSNNSLLLKIFHNEIAGTLDLRKIKKDWVRLKTKYLNNASESEGFFECSIFGFVMVIKNPSEIRNEKGLNAESDQAIYKIVGPNEEIIADNIQGYDEANKIYLEKTTEFQKVVEEEFNKLNNNQK